MRVSALLNEVFGGWPRLDVAGSSADFYRWKYLSNPVAANPPVVAESGGEIVGCIHTVPVRVKIRGSTVVGSIGSDMAVREAFRQLGVRREMQAEYRRASAESGVSFIYYISGNPIVIQTGLKHDRVFPLKMVNMVRIVDIGAHLRVMPMDSNLIAETGYRGARILNRFAQGARGSIKRVGSFTLRDVWGFGAEADVLWEGVSGGYDFIVERRSGYLNWKYLDSRVGRFRVRGAYDESGALLGYCVSRINRYLGDYPLGYVVDLLALPGRLDVVDALVGDAVSFFDGANVNLVNYQAVRGHPYAGVFARHGFLDSRIEVMLFYMSYGGDDPIGGLGGSLPERMFISWGDHDVLPVKGGG